MRAVLQRVTRAAVTVDGTVVGRIAEPGLVVFLGINRADGAAQARWMARKIHGLRILREEESVQSTGAPVLLISQFTLYGDARAGRRPTWAAAAPGNVAEPLYMSVCEQLQALGVPVATGVFGAHMEVETVNDGPFTLIIDSPRP